MRYNEQEQEEMDFNPQPELVNAFAIGRQLMPSPNKVARVPGKWAVVYTCEICCPLTDALIGYGEEIQMTFDTKDEAYAYVGENFEYLGVMPPAEWVSDEDREYAARAAEFAAWCGSDSDEVPF